MTKFNQTEFDHLKKLCRLALTPEEDAEIFPSIQKVLGYVELLDEIDTEGVASCNFVLRTSEIDHMREDEVKDLLPIEKFLANTPENIGGMVRVPTVMNTNE
jgi:aspartyl-tRNA(Asn)/glutamyl-tRNA(Gln) amidotransferase subunit C